MRGCSTSKEFVVPLENVPGGFADLVAVLERAGVDVRGFACDSRGEFAVARLLVDEPERASGALRGAAIAHRVNEALCVRSTGRRGEVAALTQRLAASGVNLSAAYAAVDADGGALLAFVTDDAHSARKVLERA